MSSQPRKTGRRSGHRRVVGRTTGTSRTTSSRKAAAPIGRGAQQKGASTTPPRRAASRAPVIPPTRLAAVSNEGQLEAPVRRPWGPENLQGILMIGALAVCILAATFNFLYQPDNRPTLPPLALPAGVAGLSLGPTNTPTPIPTATPRPPPQVAILAGHWAGDQPPEGTVPDTGAVCADGLREVDINLAVAERASRLLKQDGYRVELLQEFDDRLKKVSPDYAPDVLLAIHSDSCVNGPDYPFATGYKIAHAEPSANPESDDRLVACLRRDYEAAMKPYGKPFNENTITPDMTAYHAFREIVDTTPAAIVELGFLYNDRAVLTGRQDEIAKAIEQGLTSFLKGDSCAAAAP